jgi:hypothetical protein
LDASSGRADVGFEQRTAKWKRFDLAAADDESYDTWRSGVSRAFDKKRGSDISDIKSLLPGLNTTEGTVYLPSTISDDENNIVRSMGVLAKDLGMTVVLIPYGERKVEQLARETYKYAAGVSFVILDYKRHLVVKGKSDLYEEGRTFARAQQIIGGFSKIKSLGLDALRKSNRWFGNNPNEHEGSGRSRVPVAYTAKGVHNLFIEKEWAKELGSLLLNLLHKSFDLLSEDEKRLALSENIRPFSECVSAFMERTRVVTPASGRKPAVTKRKIPRLPRDNPILTKNEMLFVNDILKPIFTFPAPKNNSEWLEVILNSKWSDVRASMEGQAIARDELLTRFAALTTKRLQNIRKSVPGVEKNARKVDIKDTILNTFLISRGDPYGEFAAELASLDPQCKHAFKAYGAGDSSSKSVLKGSSIHLRAKLRQSMIEFRVYQELSISTIPKPDSGKKPVEGEGSTLSEADKKAILEKVQQVDALTSSHDVRGLIKEAYANSLFESPQEVDFLVKHLSNLWKGNTVKNAKNNTERLSIARTFITGWVKSGKPDFKPSS